LEALQLRQRAKVRALGGIDAALQAGERIAGASIHVAKESVLLGLRNGVLAGFLDVVGPQFRFQPGEAAEQPIGANEGIDQETFQMSGWCPILVIACGDRFQFGRIFSGNDLPVGVNAGLQCIEAGDGFALRSARTRGELRITTIRLDLTNAGHIAL
jgi:hypothetical protein